MKYTALWAIVFVGVLGLSTTHACSQTKQGDSTPYNTCPQGEVTKTYSTQKAFEKAEGKTCKSATDGCNTYVMQDGKVFAGTEMYCEDIYGKNGKEQWSCKIKNITSKEIFIQQHGKTCETATDGVNTFFGKDFSLSTRMGYPENFVADWTCIKHKTTYQNYIVVLKKGANKKTVITSVKTLKDLQYGKIIFDSDGLVMFTVQTNNTETISRIKKINGVDYIEKDQEISIAQNNQTSSDYTKNHLKNLGASLDKNTKTTIDTFVAQYHTTLSTLRHPEKAHNQVMAKIEKIIADFLAQYPSNKALPTKAKAIYNSLQYLKISLIYTKN